jgi:hypothetical protein
MARARRPPFHKERAHVLRSTTYPLAHQCRRVRRPEHPGGDRPDLAVLSILAATGLINWLLPRGGGQPLRHLLRWIHEGAAVVFVVLILWHLGLHVDYLKRGWKRFGPFGKP